MKQSTSRTRLEHRAHRSHRSASGHHRPHSGSTRQISIQGQHGPLCETHTHTHMQTIHAREPHKLERQRPSIPNVLLAQRRHLRKHGVVVALHVPEADRRLVHQQLERLGPALGRYGGSQDERADAHRLVELRSRWVGSESVRDPYSPDVAYVDAQEQLGVCAALEVDTGRCV